MGQKRNPLAEALLATKPALRWAMGISIFINLALFASPLYSMQVYDRVLSSRNLGTLAMLTLIVGIFLLFNGLLDYVRTGILVRGGVRFHDALSKPVFELAMRAQLAGRPAAATQALKDADTVREALVGGTITSLFDVPWTPIFVGVCFLFHPMLGLVALGGAILIFACAVLTEYSTRKRLQDAGLSASEAQRFANGSLRNAEVVRGLGMGDAVLDRWLGAQTSALAAQAKATEESAIYSSTTKVVRMGVQTALLGVGAWLAIDRLISPGVMMAAMIIMGRALQPVEQAVANWKRIAGARLAYRRLGELFEALPAPPQATALPEPKGKLAVEGLVLKPANSTTTIVKDVSFALEAGTALAIIGPSGSGKSSLAKALAGIWKPALGAVRLDGAALTQWDSQQLGQHIGYLPQEIDFFAGTIAENIARLAAPDDEAVIAAAVAAGVHETILKQPHGYQSVLGDGQTVLSGGMRQRVALARAIYGNPCLVIMDEPNSNLDSDGEAALAKAIAALKARGTTVVAVTHRPQLLSQIDQVLLLNGGRLQHFGARDAVLEQLNGPKLARLKQPAKTVAEPVAATAAQTSNSAA